MKGIFDPESPFSQFLSRIADLLIINVLMLICSIPIITVGAAVAAAHKTTQNMVYDTGTGVFLPFFRAFKDNFKQATIVWLATVFFIAVLVGYFLLVTAYTVDSTRNILLIILAVGALILIALTTYMYPLMVRYENTLKQHFLNAILLILFNIPRTIGIILVSLIPAAIAFFFTTLFIQIGIIWLLAGFSFLMLITNNMMKPIFDKLEEKKAAADAKAAEEAALAAAQAAEEADETE